MSDYTVRMEKMSKEDKAKYDEKKREAAKAYKERQNTAKSAIKAFLSSPEADLIPADVKSAIEYLTGSGQRIARSGVNDELANLLLAGPVSAVDIFTKFEYGRPTMEKKIREFIKREPEDRLWVAFEKGNYVVKGTGEFAPEGWTGYLPTKKEEL